MVGRVEKKRATPSSTTYLLPTQQRGEKNPLENSFELFLSRNVTRSCSLARAISPSAIGPREMEEEEEGL